MATIRRLQNFVESNMSQMSVAYKRLKFVALSRTKNTQCSKGRMYCFKARKGISQWKVSGNWASVRNT